MFKKRKSERQERKKVEIYWWIKLGLEWEKNSKISLFKFNCITFKGHI